MQILLLNEQYVERYIEQYRALRLRALQSDPASFGSTYESFQQRTLDDIKAQIMPSGDPYEKFFVAAIDDDERMVSTAWFSRESAQKGRHKGYIFGVYTAPEARRQGLSRRVLQKIIAHASEIPGLEQINLEVVTTSVAARNLYLSLGFQVYGLEKRCMKLGDTYWDEELMTLHLDPLPAAQR
ncbi:GNAT family N-acetyltransferase [Tengunoibacter tsumagoiensis]|uniref:GNAT family N-acetyltransferase n=1 Tax=Tengunoibacter tsumagoiensis TaxID=2014871 RepID=A0A402A0P8_9CHLR|nr:GNAT family protein [Tengunoibacter tsumagoiensis]GCE12728.1 GNAT family N-acetyltransferase [Tengunoibacter tsumagoiensis]